MLKWCASELGGEVALVDCVGDVVWCGAEDGEALFVLVLVGGVWLSGCGELGFGVVDCEAGVGKLVVDSGDGLWDEVGWNTDIEVVKVSLCQYWCLVVGVWK